MLNSTKAKPKKSQVDKQMNRQIVFVFISLVNYLKNKKYSRILATFFFICSNLCHNLAKQQASEFANP
jgi:hypothetical protein